MKNAWNKYEKKINTVSSVQILKIEVFIKKNKHYFAFRWSEIALQSDIDLYKVGSTRLEDITNQKKIEGSLLWL